MVGVGMMANLEHCCFCGDPTGRAGKGEDSIYLGDIGPLCESCYQEIEDAIDAQLEADITRLEAEAVEFAYNAGETLARVENERVALQARCKRLECQRDRIVKLYSQWIENEQPTHGEIADMGLEDLLGAIYDIAAALEEGRDENSKRSS